MTITPARALVQAFGDVPAMAAMYADDVVWRLNHSLAANIAGPHVGRAAVTAFNEAVFAKFYEPGSVTVELLDEVGDEASSVVRLNFRATSRRGHPYAVEYVLFVKTVGGPHRRRRRTARHAGVAGAAPGQRRGRAAPRRDAGRCGRQPLNSATSGA